MSAAFKLFPRLMDEVVQVVRSEWDTADPAVKPIYQFGTYKELTKRYVQKSNMSKAKYPLIWLVWEANENKQTWENTSFYKISPRIFICSHTKSDYTSIQRYEKNFEAVLYPIFELLKQAINDNSDISYFSAKSFEIWEHLHWGDSLKDKNKMFDTLDALEIRFKELKITPGSC